MSSGQDHSSQLQMSLRIEPGDWWGGLTAAAVILPQALAFGVALFVPFGFSPAHGALAGLIGAVCLSGLAGAVGGTRGLVSAPTGPSLVLLSGALAALAAAGVQGGDLLLGLALITLWAGGFQFLIGISGGGRLIKYIPYPVISGFMTGTAVLMVVSQIDPLSFSGTPAEWRKLAWLPLFAAAVTYAAMSLSPRLTRRVPATITGLVVGTIAFHLAAAFGPGDIPGGWMIGALPGLGDIKLHFRIAAMADLPYGIILGAALAFAILSSLNSLLTAVVADVETGERHDAKRTLTGGGIAQMVTGFFGGMGGSGTTAATMVAIRSGAGQRAALMTGVILILLLAVGRDIGRILPVGVLAGLVLHAATRMIDSDIAGWLRRSGTRMDAAIALLVIGVTIAFGLIAGVAVGVAIAVIQFIHWEMKHSVVHRRSTASQTHSLRQRTDRERAVLEEHGDRIVMYELRGNLFFATADQLLNELATDIKRPAWIILHLRRVRHVDLTALRIFVQIAQQLKRHGGHLYFCDVHEGSGVSANMEESMRRIDPDFEGADIRTFNGRDDALEHAENALLTELGENPTQIVNVIPLEETDLCRHMAEEEIAMVADVLATREVKAGDVIFDSGDRGEELFIILSGEVDIRLSTGTGRYKRLTSNGPGTFFGELAFLVPGPRSASAVARADTRLLVLDRAGFRTLIGKDPETAVELLMTLAKMQVSHQRWSVQEIQRLSEW